MTFYNSTVLLSPPPLARKFNPNGQGSWSGTNGPMRCLSLSEPPCQQGEQTPLHLRSWRLNVIQVFTVTLKPKSLLIFLLLNQEFHKQTITRNLSAGQLFREGTENDKRHCVLAWSFEFANIKICECKKYRHHLKKVKLLTYGTYATHTHTHTHVKLVLKLI